MSKKKSIFCGVTTCGTWMTDMIAVLSRSGESTCREGMVWPEDDLYRQGRWDDKKRRLVGIQYKNKIYLSDSLLLWSYVFVRASGRQAVLSEDQMEMFFFQIWQIHRLRLPPGVSHTGANTLLSSACDKQAMVDVAFIQAFISDIIIPPSLPRYLCLAKKKSTIAMWGRTQRAPAASYRDAAQVAVADWQ